MAHPPTRAQLQAAMVPTRHTELFGRARDDFLQSLTEHERTRFSSCGSVAELLAGIKAHETFSRSRRRTTSCIAKVKAFGDNLEPFFKIMEILCAAHPEWANIAFGALRLTLQLATHFITFFEKLCNVIESINARLPRYAELYERLVADPKPPTPRLRMSLQQTYTSLFEFFQAVASVFSNSKGKAKGAAFVVADLMWKPFDLRFQTVVEKINFHQAIVKEELDLAAMDKIQDDIEVLKDVQMEQATRRAQREILDFLHQLENRYKAQSDKQFAAAVVRWINSPDFKENLGDAQEERTEGTAEWIFEDPVFAAWRNRQADASFSTQQPDSFLWINGKPGSGKTVLAGSIVEELSRDENSGDSPPVSCYYFFNQNSGRKNTRIDAYRAVAAQIFHQCRNVRSVRDIIALATTEIATDTWASEQELLDFIQQCLEYIPNMYLVLDGVDECDNNTKLLRDTMEWCSTSSARVAVLSRPDVAILRRSVNSGSMITLSPYLLADDISRYLMWELEAMGSQGLLPDNSDIPSMVRHLNGRAEGMFLWTRVMMAYLNSPALTRQQRLEIIMEQTPSGLDRLEDLYSRIKERINSLDKPSKELAHTALLWVAHAQLSGLELKEAIFPNGWDIESGDACPEFEHAVIVSCRGFIEKKNSGVFKFIHLTARSFVQNGTDEPGGRPPMIPDIHVAKALMASTCVSYLTAKLLGKPLSGKLGLNADPKPLISQQPLLRYAARNWPDLALDALDNFQVESGYAGINNMVSQVGDYLDRGLGVMAWVETLYTLAYEDLRANLELLISRSEILAERLDSSQTEARHLLHGINELMGDICRLDKDWHQTLTTSPCEIWGDVTIFAKSKFFVPTKAGNLESLAPSLVMEPRDDAVKPLFSTSRNSADAKRLAVLSIFPCRHFRDGWEGNLDIPFYPEAPKQRGKVDNPPQNTPTATDDTTQNSNVPISPISPRTSKEIKDACSGWTATFEIFSVMAASSESVLFISIALDPFDVEIGLRQSLWYSISVFWGDPSTWICSFTLSISPQLDTFIVLNKLTHLESTQSQNTITIPLMERLRYDKLWTTERHFDSGNRQEGYYRYQFTWSMDGKYLAFADFDCVISRSREDGTSILLFLVTNDPKGPRLGFISSITRSSLSKGINGIEFNPSGDLLLFQDQDETYLWNFMDEHAELKPFRLKNDSNKLFESYEITFSHCGRFLAVYSRGKPWPELVPVADYLGQRSSKKRQKSLSEPMVYSKRRRQVDSDDEDEEEEVQEDDQGDVPMIDVSPIAEVVMAALNPFSKAELTLLPPPVKSVSSSTIVVSGGSSGAMTMCNINSNEVEIRSTDGKLEVRTPIVKLPQSFTTRGMSAQVTAPDQEDDPRLYKVILHASPSGMYISGLPSGSQHLPIIVRKDERALQPIIKPLAIEESLSRSLDRAEGAQTNRG